MYTYVSANTKRTYGEITRRNNAARTRIYTSIYANVRVREKNTHVHTRGNTAMQSRGEGNCLLVKWAVTAFLGLRGSAQLVYMRGNMYVIDLTLNCRPINKCGIIAFVRVSISYHTRDWTNAGLMLGQRLRRWPNIKPALVQRLELLKNDGVVHVDLRVNNILPQSLNAVTACLKIKQILLFGSHGSNSIAPGLYTYIRQTHVLFRLTYTRQSHVRTSAWPTCVLKLLTMFH